MKNHLHRLPEYALWLSLAVLAWFAFAVFAPKIGLIGWQTGFGFMTVTAGPILLAIAALVAVIALALAYFRKPRGVWWKAALALAIPAVLFAGLLSVRAQGEAAPPIHDVSTDVYDPPQFSAQTLALREEWGANPLNDYATPLGQLEMWQDRVDPEMAIKTHADVIAENYGDLQPIATQQVSQQRALDAAVAAMADIGLQDIRRDPATGTVEGVAETFAYGFRDDVIVRIRDGRIDMRSASRVGVSDLGYNAERLRELSEAIEQRLGN
jgi:hypothetical protein